MITPLDLQDALVEEMSRILDGYTYKTPTGGRIPMHVYSQNAPVRLSEDDEDPVPYIIVRLNSGEDKGERESDNTIRAVIIVATWDDDPSDQGYRDVMNIMQKIYERFAKNPSVNGVGVFAGEFDWAMQEDAYFPYSFGACSLTFNVSAIRREDPFI